MGSQRGGSPPLVGRTAERARLDEEFHRVVQGGFRCLLIDGEAGVGKTRLALDLMSREREGATVLRARGHPLGSTSAFGLWSDLLDGHLRGLTASAVQTLGGGLVEDLAGLLRSAAAIHGSWRDDVPRERVRAALATVLANLSKRGPVIALLDDIHLADASSWEALGYLAHDLTDAPVLTVATVRIEEVVERTLGRHVLFGLEQDDALTRITLRRFDQSGIAQLAAQLLHGPTPPPELVGWLFERSRGNPLFATTLLEALLAEGGDLAAPTLVATPRTLADRVRIRLDVLDGTTREVVELLAVIGHPVRLSELGRIDPRCFDVLVTVLGSGLVTERQGDPEALELSHPVIENAVYEQMDLGRRRSLHRRVARTLLAEGEVGMAARHFVRVAHRGDPEAIDAVVQALAECWRRGHFAEAFELLGSLNDLIPSGDSRWVDVLNAMPHNPEWSSVYNRIPMKTSSGITALREMNRVLSAGHRKGDHARRAVAHLYLAQVLGWCAGELDEAAKWAESARTGFQVAGDHERSRLAANELAWINALAGDFSAQEAVTRSVLLDAEAAGDQDAVVMALGSQAAAEYTQGRFSAAKNVLRRSIDLAHAGDNPARERYGLAVLAVTCALSGNIEEGRRLVREADAVSHTVSDPLVANAGVCLSFLAGDMGATIRQGRRVVSTLGPVQGSWCMTFVAMAAAEAGDLSAARSLLSHSGEVLSGRPMWIMSGHHEWATGMLAVAEGKAQLSVSGLQKAASSLRTIGALPYASRILIDAADAAMLAGQPDVAEAAAHEAMDIAGALDYDHYRGLALMAAAAADLSRADHPAAMRHATDGLTRLNGQGYPGLEGRCQALLGHALTPTDRAEAIVCLQAASEAFQELGMFRRHQHVLAHLAGLGKPGRRAADGLRGPATLTHREREVAAHAVEGLTAREIGDRLFIGERTVETHLAHVYAKLGVHNRLGLVRAVGTGTNPATFHENNGST